MAINKKCEDKRNWFINLNANEKGIDVACQSAVIRRENCTVTVVSKFVSCITWMYTEITCQQVCNRIKYSTEKKTKK